MNKKLLPKLEEITPVDKNGVFGDCRMNKNFVTLPFIKKLQIINDIIRQTILINPYPNPINHADTLEGDCYTAAIAGIEYLKELNLGQNYRCVICRKRKYDPDEIVSKHVAILLDDKNGETYFFDAAPFISSKYGKVLKFDQASNFYQDFFILDDDEFQLLFLLKEMFFKDSTGKLDIKEIPFYTQVINEASKKISLNGLTSHAYIILSKYMQDKYSQDQLLIQSAKLDPFNKYNDNYLEKKSLRIELLKKQIKIWEEELISLLKSNTNFERQLELAQNIYQEQKNIDRNLYGRKINLGGGNIRLTNLTPRFFMEENLATSILFSSEKFSNIRENIKQNFLNKMSLYYYSSNLSTPTEMTHIIPQNFYHSYQLNPGASEIFLHKSTPTCILKETDRLLLRSQGFVQASIMFLAGYPEQQVMTRFMYPNPKLENIEKDL